MLELWGRTNSINVQKVCWMVAELALPVRRHDAGMAFGVVGEDWYGRLNPNRLVPTIRDGDVVLWESNAIVRYLATRHAAGTWMPADPAARAQAEQWMDWQQTTVMTGLSPLFLGLVRTPPERRDAAVLARAADDVARAMAMLDAHLAGRDYMLGDQPTVADIALGCPAYRWYALPVAHAQLPNLRRWYERLATRPAFAAHVMLPLT